MTDYKTCTKCGKEIPITVTVVDKYPQVKYPFTCAECYGFDQTERLTDYEKLGETMRDNLLLNMRDSRDIIAAKTLALWMKRMEEEYLRGRADMQNEIIDKLGDYEANKCAQIAAGIPVRKGDKG